MLAFCRPARRTAPASPTLLGWIGTCLLLLLVQANVIAATDESALIHTPSEPIDATHTKVSAVVEDMAKRVDRFFADDRAFEEENDSTLQISIDASSEEGEALKLNGSIRAKMALPGAKNRLRLVLEDDPDRQAQDAPIDDPFRALGETSDYTLGLEGEVQASRWLLRPSLGVRATWPPDPYARLRAIRYITLGDWVSRLSGTASWFSEDGAGLDGTVDFDHRLSDEILFRSATSLAWRHDTAQTNAAQVFSLFQRLASRAGLAYEIGAGADDDPGWEVHNYFARLRYRRLVYKTWAYVDIQPMIAWPEENDFHEELSLLVRLELNFGKAYR